MIGVPLPKFDNPPESSGMVASVGGRWKVKVQYLRGESDHVLVLEQHDGMLVGTHASPTLQGDLRGSVQDNKIRFRSAHRFEGTSIGYDFSGALEGETISGTVTMGEYGQARWTATRHPYS